MTRSRYRMTNGRVAVGTSMNLESECRTKVSEVHCLTVGVDERGSRAGIPSCVGGCGEQVGRIGDDGGGFLAVHTSWLAKVSAGSKVGECGG